MNYSLPKVETKRACVSIIDTSDNFVKTAGIVVQIL